MKTKLLILYLFTLSGCCGHVYRDSLRFYISYQDKDIFDGNYLTISKYHENGISTPVNYRKSGDYDIYTGIHIYKSSVFEAGIHARLILSYTNDVKSDTVDVLIDKACQNRTFEHRCGCEDEILKSVKFNGVEHFGVGNLLFVKE